jgi:hypothetical protein
VPLSVSRFLSPDPQVRLHTTEPFVQYGPKSISSSSCWGTVPQSFLVAFCGPQVFVHLFGLVSFSSAPRRVYSSKQSNVRHSIDTAKSWFWVTCCSALYQICAPSFFEGKGNSSSSSTPSLYCDSLSLFPLGKEYSWRLWCLVPSAFFPFSCPCISSVFLLCSESLLYCFEYFSFSFQLVAFPNSVFF